MSRIVTRTWQTLIDLATLSLALWLAFLVRFDGDLPLQMLKRLMFVWPYVVALQYSLLLVFGVHRFAWRYVGLRETLRIGAGTAVAGGLLLTFRLGSEALRSEFGYVVYTQIPIGVIAINLVLVFVGITGVRALRRVVGEKAERGQRRADTVEGVPTLLIGAGQAGLLVAKEVAARPDIGILPVGFLDDDPAKLGTDLYGVPVLGRTSDLVRICEKRGAKQALITIANAPGSQIRRITEMCEAAEIPVKIIPGLYEIVGGAVSLARIRDVAIEDLLGREPVDLDMESISGLIHGQVVLVTGAGGSIGSELCRQLCRFEPKQLLLLERAENALFDIHRELRASFPNAVLMPVVGDICDAARLDRVFSDHAPNVIFHAAAHKHVPMMEWNPGEAIKNNVFGTRTVADAADAHGAEIFVQVSTDKAVNPTSVMGATKRVAEMYLQNLSARSSTRFVTVRLGNVLGSNGSVVKIFREQIAAGGPVTVTHPDMQRYFMMIPEACQLILQAGALARGGEIFVLDMGQPVKIVDLARDMIRLSGYEPGRDIEVRFTGVRPGEKLYEELLLDDEHYDRTVHPKIVVGRIPAVSAERIDWALASLSETLEGPAEAARRQMAAIIPEAKLSLAPPTAAVDNGEGGESSIAAVPQVAQ